MTDIAGRLFDRAVSACKKLDALMAVLALKGSNRTTLMRARDVILEQANELDALRALSEAEPVREDWKLVPKKPTPEMLGAWYRYKSGHRWPGDPEPRDTSDYGAYSAMLAKAPAHPVVSPPNEPVVTVKPLEWVVVDRAGAMQASANSGGYTIEPGRRKGRYYVTRDGQAKAIILDATIDEAKAAAQADYATRIRSALVVSSPNEAAELVRDEDDEAFAVLRKQFDYVNKSNTVNFDRAEAAESRAKLLTEALEPFVDVCGEGDEDFPDDTKVTIQFGRTTHYALTLGNFRNAARALVEGETP